VHLVQILLPLYHNAGAPLPRALYDRVRGELAGRFGGLTAFTRAPAEGHWRTEGETKRDDIVVFEVMTESLDLAWWRAYASWSKASARRRSSSASRISKSSDALRGVLPTLRSPPLPLAFAARLIRGTPWRAKTLA